MCRSRVIASHLGAESDMHVFITSVPLAQYALLSATSRIFGWLSELRTKPEVRINVSRNTELLYMILQQSNHVRCIEDH